MSDNTLKLTKVRSVKTPCRAHADDAGIDFFIPEDLTENDLIKTINTTGIPISINTTDLTDRSSKIKSITLYHNESVLIPCGIKVRLPKGHALIFMNKSGVASKKHLVVGACVVDENYTGECHINLHNVGTTAVTLVPGEKIVQGLVIPINYCEVEETGSEEELYQDFNSDRGAGGFGSTGA